MGYPEYKLYQERPYIHRWYSSGSGRWWRRRLYKAERALASGHGREHSVKHYASNVNWKLS